MTRGRRKRWAGCAAAGSWLTAWAALGCAGGTTSGATGLDDPLFGTEGTEPEPTGSAGLESAGNSKGGESASTSEGGSDGAATQDSATRGGSGSDGESHGTASENGLRFDIPDATDEPNGSQEKCECRKADFSYIWIANSTEGTVSKVNTRTLIEEGRYWTNAKHDGSPSRTSVSVDGEAAIVANRKVGLLKVWAQESSCEDRNKNGKIDTSHGPTEILPFGEDECVAWYVDFPGMTTQRPVQWTAGIYNDTTCRYEDQKVWTITGAEGTDLPNAFCGQNGVWVHRLDALSGAIEKTFHIPESEFPCENTRGPYGATVDSRGNLWFQKWHARKRLVRVDFETFDYEIFDFGPILTQGTGGYGIIADTEDRVWLSGTARFDYALNEWKLAPKQFDEFTGMALDAARGRIWMSKKATGPFWVDVETMEEGESFAWPDGKTNVEARGVTVDTDGFLWGVRKEDNIAFKFDPDAAANRVLGNVQGFVGAYTYSDMAGGQLLAVGSCLGPPK